MTTPALVSLRSSALLRPRFGNTPPAADPPQPTIRRATAHDTPKAFPLWLDAFQAGSTAPHIRDLANKASRREVLETMFKEEFWVGGKKPSPSRHAFVMEGAEPSKLLGLGVMETVQSFQGFGRPPQKNAVVWAVAVDKDHQRQGHGTQMLAHLTQAARDENVNTMMTLASRNNRSFYEKQGFTARHIPIITPVTEWLLEHLIGYRHALVKNLRPPKQHLADHPPSVKTASQTPSHQPTISDTASRVEEDVKEAS